MRKLSLHLIVGIIFLFLTQILFSADFKAEVEKVKATIAEIKLGLKRYKIVNDAYPEDGNRNLVSTLYPDYVTFQPQEIKGGLLLDPWGNPYVYQRYEPGDNLRWHTYVIYSIGPNGIDEDGWGDDIGNW